MASPSVSKKPALSQEKDREISEELQRTLQELKGLLSEECFNSAQRLIGRINRNPEDLQLGLDFFNCLKKQLKFNKVEKRPAEGQGNKQQQKSNKYTVKVFLKVTGQTFGADKALLERVKRMSQSVAVETTRNLQDSHVVIVFCPIVSRVGSDVEAAMTDVRASCGEKPVILVLMHHTFDEDYSTAGTRWSDEYDNVVLDVHVLFHETNNGLLTCPKNDEAAKQMVKEMEKYKESVCIIT